jgi:hypothetical protein
VFFFLAGLSIWYENIHLKKDNNTEAYVKLIEQKLNSGLKVARHYGTSIKYVIENSDRPTFAALTQKTPYPYFVFRNNSLYYWSDNNFLPKPEQLNSRENTFFVSLKSGKFVVRRDSVMKRGDVFEIYFFIPLSQEYPIENDYLTSGLNPDIFGNTSLLIGSHHVPSAANIFTSDGKYLFSVTFPSDTQAAKSKINFEVFILISLGLLCLVFQLVVSSVNLCKKKSADAGIILLVAGLLLIRGLLMASDYPFNLTNFDLFNSKYFASSVLSPSLGDFLLNLFCLLLFSLVVLSFYPTTSLVRNVLKIRGGNRKVTSVILLLFSFNILFYNFHLLLTLFGHSQWQVDVTESLSFNYLRAFSLVCVAILFMIFVCWAYILSKLLLQLNKD